ncbi:protein tyrosine phosphatase [Diplocarpon rosae]|nr:protein tyrosine phosphatase [Diplocarpon rosae]
MGVYADSSADPFDDPKVETIVELLTRIWGSAIGVVSTAFVADATPTALTGHSRDRAQYASLLEQSLRGVTNYTWTPYSGADVFFGGGAEQFIAGKTSYQGRDYYKEFQDQGYAVSMNKTTLEALGNDTKALGIFCTSNLPVWLDRNVYTANLNKTTNDPSGNKQPALDLPGLKDMTLKALDILHTRGGSKGFFLIDDREKRNAIGVYQNSGLSQYTVTNASVSYNTGVNFPVNWDPRYTLALGMGAHPDIRENFQVHKYGPRTAAANITGFPSDDYYVNPTDNPDGYIINGTLQTYENQGVHSLTDVPVFAMGPCQELFGGVYGNIDIFFNMAACLGLARGSDAAPSDASAGMASGAASPADTMQRGIWVGVLVLYMTIDCLVGGL